MRSDKQISKYLCLLLRHEPEKIGLELDTFGWGSVKIILDNIQDLTMERLEKIVREDTKNSKDRYSFNEEKTLIRANQGHNGRLNINLQLSPVEPPAVLYHGTSCRNETIILNNGLCKMQRQHVHLSADIETAKVVAKRRKGKHVIFQIPALEMFNQGYKFYCSKNGVWLAEHIPAKFITIMGYLEEVTKGNRESEAKNRTYHKGN